MYINIKIITGASTIFLTIKFKMASPEPQKFEDQRIPVLES